MSVEPNNEVDTNLGGGIGRGVSVGGRWRSVVGDRRGSEDGGKVTMEKNRWRVLLSLGMVVLVVDGLIRDRNRGVDG